MDIRTPNYSNRKKTLKKKRKRVTPRPYIHKIRTRRPNPRKRKIISILLIFVVIGLIAILSAQVASKFFPVKKISISGCQRLSKQTVMDVLDIEVDDDSILKVSIPDLKKRLEDLSFVKEASVSKKVIRGILEIDLSEREAVAALKYRTGDKTNYALIDSEGILLERCNNTETLKNVITIVNVEDSPMVELGERLDIASVNLALSIIEKSKPNGFYPEISTIDVSNPNKISIQLKNNLIAFISAKFIRGGLKNINLVLKDKKHNENRGYLDARFKAVVYKGGT